MIKSNELPVAIIGAGPVGLAAAAHLLKMGIKPIVLERGSEVGANIRDWQHVPLFTPWRSLIDGEAKKLLLECGWEEPKPTGLPTGEEFLETYLKPLSQVPEINSVVRLESEVKGVARANFDKIKATDRNDAPFVLRISGQNQQEHDIQASAVIDASGTWTKPNPIGSNGLPAIGEIQFFDKIWYGIPNVLNDQMQRYSGRRCLIIGAGYSAANVALDLVKLSRTAPETDIIWAIRGDSLSQLTRDHGEGPPSRIALGKAVLEAQESGKIQLVTDFRAFEVKQIGDDISVFGNSISGVKEVSGINEIICTTGQRPDLAMLRELRTAVDPALECVAGLRDLVDPSVHSCYSAPPHGWRELRHPSEPNFFIVGMKSYGRTPTFLTITGYQQVSSIAYALAGEFDLADQSYIDTSLAMADEAAVNAVMGGQR